MNRRLEPIPTRFAIDQWPDPWRRRAAGVAVLVTTLLLSLAGLFAVAWWLDS